METYSIITFDNTHHAIAAEKCLMDAGLNIRMIPVPQEVTSNCGLSIRFDPQNYDAIRSLLCHLEDARYYHVSRENRKKTVTPYTDDASTSF